MTTPLETMHLYSKILTGMVLLLNIGLLISIRIALKHARLSLAADGTEAGSKRWSSAKRQLIALILSVVAINGAAVFANHRLVGATQQIAAEIPQFPEAEFVLSMARPSK